MTFLKRLMCLLFGHKPIVDAHDGTYRFVVLNYNWRKWNDNIYYDRCKRCDHLAPHFVKITPKEFGEKLETLIFNPNTRRAYRRADEKHGGGRREEVRGKIADMGED